MIRTPADGVRPYRAASECIGPLRGRHRPLEIKYCWVHSRSRARSCDELDEIGSLVKIGRVVCCLFDALVFAETTPAMDATVMLNVCEKMPQLRIECFHVLQAGQVPGRG